jgi:hypothetical protein
MRNIFFPLIFIFYLNKFYKLKKKIKITKFMFFNSVNLKKRHFFYVNFSNTNNELGKSSKNSGNYNDLYFSILKKKTIKKKKDELLL